MRNPTDGQGKILERAILRALSGEGAHASTTTLFDDLDWRAAGKRPRASPYSVFQLLNHMIYWQEWALEWLDGTTRPLPQHASGSWPGKSKPAGEKEWEAALERFRSGVKRLARLAGKTDWFSKRGARSRLEMVHTIASHNSYHAGQVVVLRQALGRWPPPSGGLTW